MARTEASHGGSGSWRCNDGRDQHENYGKYARFTSEQVEVLEEVFAKCPKPTRLQRQEMICNNPIFSTVDPNQIKVWFQNRRCREKKVQEATNLQSVNKIGTAANKLLEEENDCRQKQMSQLTSPSTTRISCESAANSPRSPNAANDPTRFLNVAEEIRKELFSKATGTMLDWVQVLGNKLGPGPVETLNVSHNCTGVAARACGLVSLEPTTIIEILKDRPSWLRVCRKMEVFSKFPAANEGTIELIYLQFYAPTMLAPPRDFWTLRYTSTLEDGSLMVAEKSLSSSGICPSPFADSPFIRAKMLASGYLVRPSEGRGSIIHMVDHLDLEALCVSEVLRPLYESSELVAEKMTMAAMHYLGKVAEERIREIRHGKEPPLRPFCQRLIRCFNDALNGFKDDGWSLMSYNAEEELIIAINSTKKFWPVSDSVYPHLFSGGILCVKASILLHNVSSALLVRFLREHRSEWADLGIDAHYAASLKAGSFALPALNSFNFTASSVLLGHPVRYDEILEMIRLECHSLSQKGAVPIEDTYLVQICNGVDVNAVGACSELIYAPLPEMLPDDAPLLSSGFRVLPLDSTTCHRLDRVIPSWTSYPASDLGVCTATSHEGGSSSSTNDSKSMLVVAFQFPFEHNLQEKVATMAREYILKVISSVQRIAMAIKPPPHLAIKITAESPQAVSLATLICNSYSLTFNAKLLRSNCQSFEAMLKDLWHHHDPILCGSFQVIVDALAKNNFASEVIMLSLPLPVCLFANQAALDMLETTLAALQDITLYQIFGGSGPGALSSTISEVMQQGFCISSAGTLTSVRGHRISYGQAIAWKVLANRGVLHSVAFTFNNWSFQ